MVEPMEVDGRMTGTGTSSSSEEELKVMLEYEADLEEDLRRFPQASQQEEDVHQPFSFVS